MTTGPENAAIVAFILIGAFLAVALYAAWSLWQDKKQRQEAEVRKSRVAAVWYCEASLTRKHKLAVVSVLRRVGMPALYFVQCRFCHTHMRCELHQLIRDKR